MWHLLYVRDFSVFVKLKAALVKALSSRNKLFL